jgi:flavorubredoxin
MIELKDALSEIDYIIVRHVDENYTEEIQHYTDKERIEINNIINQYFTL